MRMTFRIITWRLTSTARKEVQQNLTWTGYYSGPIDGGIGRSSIEAIKRFQFQHLEAPSGIMSDRVKQQLDREAQVQSSKVGFRYLIDGSTGAWIGIPFAYLAGQRPTARGTSYYSRDDGIEIQTFALNSSGNSLQSLYARMKDGVPNRTVWYAPYRNTWFVLAGKETPVNSAEKDFYVRAHDDGKQVRGFSMAYRPEQYPNISTIISIMSFTFDPLPTGYGPVAQGTSSNGNTDPTLITPGAGGVESAKTGATIALQNTGGTYEVPVLINGAITLPFIVDSGASDVSIPADVVLTLMRAGTINDEDFVGQKTYELADGSKVPSRVFRIRSLKIGDRIL